MGCIAVAFYCTMDVAYNELSDSSVFMHKKRSLNSLIYSPRYSVLRDVDL